MKRPGMLPGPLFASVDDRLVVHPAHAATRHCRSGLLLRHFGDHGFRGDQQARDRRRILQGRADDLGRVDDALGHQVAVLAGLSVVTEVVLIFLKDLANHDRAIIAGVDRDLAGRCLQRLAHDFDAVVCTENLIRIDWGRESPNVSAQ